MDRYHYSPQIRKKLKEFLNDKISELHTRFFSSGSKDWKVIEEELATGNFLGFKAIQQKKSYKNEEWRIFQDSESFVVFFRGKRGKAVGFNIKGIISLTYYCSDEVFRNAVIALPEIVNAFDDLQAKLEKQEKKIEISQKSILSWLEMIMENSGYAYYTTKYSNKVLLSIKMKRAVQLDIPIYLKKFQKTIPELMKAIQSYETAIRENKVKVLITNQKKPKNWKK